MDRRSPASLRRQDPHHSRGNPGGLAERSGYEAEIGEGTAEGRGEGGGGTGVQGKGVGEICGVFGVDATGAQGG